MKSKPAVIAIFILVVVVSVFSSYVVTVGQELPPRESGQYDFDVGVGYHHANVNGYRGKVGEYEVLDPGWEGQFTLRTHNRGNYLDLGGEIKDEDDQRHIMRLDANRIFQTETSYTRYRHYLDHNPLDNQDFLTDVDRDQNNGIIREEVKTENTFRIPFIPTLKVKADFRQLNKRGHRQATTVSKCATCHVTSQNRRVNQTTEDVKVGTEVTIGRLTFNYHHLQRSFNEGGSSPIAYYGYEAPSFPVRGFDQYNRTPDSRTYINHVKMKVDLPLQSDFCFKYERGENNNRETRHERDFQSFAFRLTTASLKYVTFNVSHYDYTMDNNVPDAMEKDVKRTGISFKTRPWRRNFLRGSYHWEDVDRRNTAQESTSKKVLSIALFSRPHRKLDFNIRYKNERVDDPFLLEQWDLFRFTQTSLPNKRDEIQLSLNWSLRGNLSLSSTVSYEDADSERYDIEEERVEFIFSLWYAPRDNLILTGSYSVIDTEIDTRSTYRTYHRRELQDFFFDNSVPYDDRSHCYNLTLNYRFTRKVALISNLTFVNSNADFDSRLDGNVGRLSDLHIERIDTSVGLDYLYKPNISFYTKYNYRDYNDREANELDGEMHLISFGVNYSF